MTILWKFVLSCLVVALLAACSTAPSPDSTTLQPYNSPTKTAIFNSDPSIPTSTHTPGCTVQTRRPVSDPAVESLLPSVTDKDWVKGPADAYVTIIEYSDFQSPGSAALVPILDRLQAKYPQDVRLVYRHFPLSNHDKAALAVQASEAAGAQSKFWEMHDLLFEQRLQWEALAIDQFELWVTQRAGELHLDVEKFKADLNSEDMKALAQEAFERNSAIGMPGTPFLLVNGVPYNAPLDYPSLEATVALILLEKRQFSECPPITIEPTKQYVAILHTEKGDIELELFADKAPLAVNSFIFLARNNWFDGVTFHRVLPDFVAQAGDPSGTGYGGPGYAFDNEITPELTFDRPGVLAMANAGAGSNGSQFFITYAAVPRLNGGYTIFGRLISGFETLKKLSARDPSESMDLEPGDMILDVEIIEK